ncbi:MAG: hypothetical protein ACRDXB_07050 [Actinomycetes bacterium]
MLRERAVPVFRFDTAEFPGRVHLDAVLEDGEWAGHLVRDDERPRRGPFGVPAPSAPVRGARAPDRGRTLACGHREPLRARRGAGVVAGAVCEPSGAVGGRRLQASSTA